MARRVALWLCLGLWANAQAANYPCSGSKGGVSHCAGPRFVCNDGSISGSKRICSAEVGGAAQRLMPAAPAGGAGAGGGCSCRAGGMCTGSRGGRYCLDDAGRKSYERR